MNAPPAVIVGLLALAALLAILGRRVTFTWGSIHAELRPNGGRTVKDRVDRLDRNLFVIAAHLGIQEHLEKPPEEQRARPSERVNDPIIPPVIEEQDHVE